MSAPLARGIIIAASVLVAAGIAIYESEELRVWLDERRRRLAIALYSVGDGIHPQPPQSDAERAEMMEMNRSRRLDIVRRNRMELIRRAQQEGIAVDLDELSRLGSIEIPVQQMHRRGTSGSSFDDIVGVDGKLKKSEADTSATATALEQASSSSQTLRHRGTGLRGFDAGASFANPFDDEAHVLFDQSLIAPSESELHSAASSFHPQHEDASSVAAETGTIRSITPRPASTAPSLIDVPVYSEEIQLSGQSQYKSDEELEAEIEEAIRRSLQDFRPEISPLVSEGTGHSQSSSSIDSLYAPPTPRAMALQEPLIPIRLGEQQEMSQVTAFTLSPQPASRTLSPDVEVHNFMDVDEQSTSEYMSIANSEASEDDMEIIDRAPTPRSVSTLSTATFASSGTMDLDDADVESAFDELSRPETPASQTYEHAEASFQTATQNSAFLAPPQSSARITAPSEKSAGDDSESEFSVIEEGGASTPGSWTDVDTDDEGEVGNGSRVTAREH